MNEQRKSDRTTDVTDADLLRRVALGDGDAFRQLAALHGDRLYRLAFSLVGNASDAEDVVQEALTGAFRGAGRFEGRSTVKSWLTRILMTQAARFWRDRRGKRDDQLQADEHEAMSGGLSGGAAAVDAKIDLQACLEKLSPEHREVLVLREIDGMTYEEAAEVLGVPRGTVESRLFRARAELRKKLKGYGSESAER
jgi:RNA polymerase sigma-70 factor (ECF subfamily)